MQVKVASEYRPSLAAAKLCTVYRKFFPPSPVERPLDVVDRTELALKTALPGFRVRVVIERIGTNGNGNGNGNGGLH